MPWATYSPREWPLLEVSFTEECSGWPRSVSIFREAERISLACKVCIERSKRTGTCLNTGLEYNFMYNNALSCIGKV